MNRSPTSTINRGSESFTGSLTQASPDLINRDLAPTTSTERTWRVRDMASLWIGMVACVPTYLLAGGLVELGMSWWQAVVTVALGNVIVLVPMVATGHAGTKYGIPFPVLARASFGVRGAHLPALLRAAVACGWFGIQTWIGGSAIYQLLGVLSSRTSVPADLPLLGINALELVCFLMFWLLQVAIVLRGMDSIRWLENLAAPFLVAMGAALLIWAVRTAGGWGPMFDRPSQFVVGGAKEGQFWAVFLPGLTAMVGFWATLSLNIPDFTRYARSQRDQFLGQAIGLPTFMTAFSFLGVAVTSATVTIYGEAIPDPVELLGRLGGGFAVLLALLALTLATLSTNLAANIVSPANALMNVSPARVSFRKGALLAAGLGLVIFPWKLIESSEGYIFTWLVGYSALLGPVGGIVLADYYLLRRSRLEVAALYRHDGRYGYRAGVNPAAILALAVGVIPNVPGFLAEAGVVESVPRLFASFYTYAWFLGFVISALAYWLQMAGRPPDPQR